MIIIIVTSKRMKNLNYFRLYGKKIKLNKMLNLIKTDRQQMKQEINIINKVP